MYKDSSKRLTGNEVFEGFAVDLIHEVAQILSMILKKNLYCQFGILNSYLNFFFQNLITPSNGQMTKNMEKEKKKLVNGMA